MKKLNDGNKLVKEFVEELRKSEYAKGTVLFNEIDKIVLLKD